MICFPATQTWIKGYQLDGWTYNNCKYKKADIVVLFVEFQADIKPVALTLFPESQFAQILSHEVFLLTFFCPSN